MWHRQRHFPNPFKSGQAAFEWTTAAAAAANAKNCDGPAKTRIGSASRAKEIAADIGKLAKGQLDETFAANCAQLASTRISWVNKAKGIAVGIVRLVEGANFRWLYQSAATHACIVHENVDATVFR